MIDIGFIEWYLFASAVRYPSKWAIQEDLAQSAGNNGFCDVGSKSLCDYNGTKGVEVAVAARLDLNWVIMGNGLDGYSNQIICVPTGSLLWLQLSLSWRSVGRTQVNFLL